MPPISGADGAGCVIGASVGARDARRGARWPVQLSARPHGMACICTCLSPGSWPGRHKVPESHADREKVVSKGSQGPLAPGQCAPCCRTAVESSAIQHQLQNRAQSGSNQRPADLQSAALPLSYIPVTHSGFYSI